VTVSYDKRTKFRRQGQAEIDDYEAGDWLNVHVRGCKTRATDDADSSTGTTTPTNGSTTATQDLLLAKQVIGKPKKSDGSSTTTTGTTTTPETP
jgi:hypothetical protein